MEKQQNSTPSWNNYHIALAVWLVLLIAVFYWVTLKFS